MPGAGISGALAEVSLDGETVPPPCADAMPMIAMHIVSASSNGLKAAMIGIRWGEDGPVERYGGESTISISVVLFVLSES